METNHLDLELLQEPESLRGPPSLVFGPGPCDSLGGRLGEQEVQGNRSKPPGMHSPLTHCRQLLCHLHESRKLQSDGHEIPLTKRVLLNKVSMEGEIPNP